MVFRLGEDVCGRNVLGFVVRFFLRELSYWWRFSGAGIGGRLIGDRRVFGMSVEERGF